MSSLLALHLLAVTVWIGGMVFMRFVLHPLLLTAQLPADRLGPLQLAVAGRFFAIVWGAMPLTLASGFALIAGRGGFAALPPALHAMAGLGVLMGLIFVVIHLFVYRALRRAAAAADKPRAGALAGRMRALVLLNLLLGIVCIGLGAVARYGV
ncbi:CopD family protein [Plasticicumulans acidivorans]|uniref:Putative membrane protein n=1 Tax=Plasticicumulans acidivorans TaxID=886464 RepID=A0A317MYC5_9GAMM|nr:CopD family protein [Plasticicumulans acidivorans]PWV64670.1 putative membrane protein [Plasticicumulans acidivorans]